MREFSVAAWPGTEANKRIGIGAADAGELANGGLESIRDD